MSSEPANTQWQDFSGQVRLFPLPNSVLFPHVLLPLHIFEPRYRDMTAEALEGDRLIALALLAPGWEADYDGRPPIRPMACLGRIATHQRLDDGRYNLLLAGMTRVRVLEELPADKSFREATVEVCADRYPPETAVERATLQRRLFDQFRRLLPAAPESKAQLEQLLSADVPLGALTDIVAYTLGLSLEGKMALLEETNVDVRARRLVEDVLPQLKGPVEAVPPRPKFPPDFSAN